MLVACWSTRLYNQHSFGASLRLYIKNSYLHYSTSSTTCDWVGYHLQHCIKLAFNDLFYWACKCDNTVVARLFYNTKISHHSVDVVGDNLTANCQSYKLKVELLQCSTHTLTHWTAWPATGRSALQDLLSSAILHASMALSPVSSSICCIHARHGSPRRRLHPGLLSSLPAAL